jgi:predicted GNAT family acetyltransferase
MNIKIENTDTKGSAFIQPAKKKLAEMTYSIASPNLIIIDHTDVDDSLKGQGIGRKLLLKIVENARNQNIKIIPLCPFAKSVFDKEKSLQDVL